MKTFKILKTISIVLVLGSSFSSFGQIPVGQKELKVSSIAGVDSTNRGYRDDVDEQIKKQFASDTELYVAAVMYAKQLQSQITVDVNSEKDMKAVLASSDLYNACSTNIVTHLQKFLTINDCHDDACRKIVANTPSRMFAFGEASSYIDNITLNTEERRAAAFNYRNAAWKIQGHKVRKPISNVDYNKCPRITALVQPSI